MLTGLCSYLDARDSGLTDYSAVVIGTSDVAE